MAAGHPRRGTQVLQARVGAGADENPVHADVFDRGSRRERHILQRALGSSALGCGTSSSGIRDTTCHWDDHARVCAPSDEGSEAGSVDLNDLVVARTRIGSQRAPARDGLVPSPVFRGKAASSQVVERHLVGSNHARTRARFDAHVADRHAAFHGETAHRFTRVLDCVAGGAIGTDCPDDAQYQVLGGDALGQWPVDANLHGSRLLLRQALGGKDVFDFRRADAEGQRSEGSVRGGVAVAADDGQAGLGRAELRTDDVDDALVGRVDVVEREAEVLAVAAQRFHLPRRDGIGDG